MKIVKRDTVLTLFSGFPNKRFRNYCFYGCYIYSIANASSLKARIAALLRILAGCAARGGRIPAVVFAPRATKHPAKIRAVRAATAPRRVAEPRKAIGEGNCIIACYSDQL